MHCAAKETRCFPLVELYALVIHYVRTVNPVRNLARWGRKAEPGYFYAWVNRLISSREHRKIARLRSGTSSYSFPLQP